MRADRWTRLGVELEVIFVMGADVPAPKGTPYDKDSIAEYVGEARAGFELIEDRGADYSRLAVNPLIMDAGWNGGSLLAKPNKNWRNLDLDKLDGLDLVRRRRRAHRPFRRRAGPSATTRWPGSPTSSASTARR